MYEDEEAGAGGLAWAFLAAIVAGSIVAAIALAVVPRGPQNWPWAFGRAAGLVAMLLISAAGLLGLWQSHPWSRRHPVISRPVVNRLHVLLVVFTLCFVLAHVVALSLDPYAQVGIIGALVPGASTYRPLPVALGTLALYAGLLTGITAALGPRIGRRIWLPIHRGAAIVLALGWIHGVLAGSDTPQLRLLYAGIGLSLLVLAATRYMATTPGRARAGP